MDYFKPQSSIYHFKNFLIMKRTVSRVLMATLALSISLHVIGQSYVKLGPNYYSCGIPSSEIEFMKANSVNHGNQIKSNWCWAACVQMVLNYHGLKISQQDVVKRIYGNANGNQAGNVRQILYALKGTVTDERGKKFRLKSYAGKTTLSELIYGLSSKHPIIVGLNTSNEYDHAFLLTAIQFSLKYDRNGNPIDLIPDKVILRDPWAGNPSRNEMNWEEFISRLQVAIKAWVVEE